MYLYKPGHNLCCNCLSFNDLSCQPDSVLLGSGIYKAYRIINCTSAVINTVWRKILMEIFLD